MLVLERKQGQAIVIETSNGPIEVSVVRISQSHKSVKLGICAPHTVKILREELNNTTQER